MDNKFIIVPSVAEDILELKDNLRKDDVRECDACGHTPEEALSAGYVWSKCYSVKMKGNTEAMFGVVSAELADQPKTGVVWFLGSNEVFKFPVSLVKLGKAYVNEWLEEFDILMNLVDERNKKHIEWLKRIGFIFTESKKLNGYNFRRFYIKKER